MICKNCEGAYSVFKGLCHRCIEEQNEEMEFNGFTCRTCDELVHDEGELCAECHQGMLEDRADALREEQLIEKNFGG